MSIEQSVCGAGGLTWFKSSYSGSNGGQCVEVAAGQEAVHVRDSKDARGARLHVSRAGWSTFVAFAADAAR